MGRLLVVAFTIISLMLVAAVGVSAASGNGGKSNTMKNSIVMLFSGHSDQSGAHDGTTNTTNASNGKDTHNGKDKEKDDDQCKPSKHDNGTRGREHHNCDADHDSG